MMRPRLFIHIQDRELEQAILQTASARQFLIAQCNGVDSWVSQITQEAADLAIIEANDFNEHDFQVLTREDTQASTEFIFISRGEPNHFLDKFMERGAGFHLRRPFEVANVEVILQDFYDSMALSSSAAKQVTSSSLNQYGRLLGSSKVMLHLFRTLRKVSRSDLNVLIVGESGSGKELVANTIHDMGERATKPFVALNCGAISPELIDSELFGHVKGAFTGAVRDHTGVFEQAKGGTLFLDEITEMPLEHQVKLLRVLEESEYRPVGSEKTFSTDVRIIAATNRTPAEAIEEGAFRHDLYYRLAQMPVQVPPLKDRADDVTGLAEHFLAYRNNLENSAKSISPETLKIIADYHWPGNVRELRHAIERAFVLADSVIEPSHIALEPLVSSPSESEVEIPSGVPLAELEKTAIINTLKDNDGNKTDTADQLGISVKTLYNKLERYDDDDLE
ncbi:MAG: sigma-54 interaction domain-containing protein [Aestuariibacter sp.]